MWVFFRNELLPSQRLLMGTMPAQVVHEMHRLTPACGGECGVLVVNIPQACFSVFPNAGLYIHTGGTEITKQKMKPIMKPNAPVAQHRRIRFAATPCQ